MNARRRADANRAAIAERAGTIASSKGRPSAVPTPRRNVRRGSAIFVMIMFVISSFGTERFERYRESETRSGNHCALSRERSREQLAHRSTGDRAREHKS